MNVLTKVFVVLMTILSVVLVSLVVPFVANTENFKDQVAAANAAANAARAEAAVQQARADASRADLVQQLDGFKAIENSIRQSNDNLKSKLSEAKADLEKSRSDLIRTQADIANLTSANDQMAKIQVDLQKELAVRRDETVKLRSQVIELGMANNDQSSATNALRRAVRLAQENLIKTQEELAQANELIRKIPPDELARLTRTDAGPAEGGGSQPPVPINAQVTDVKQVGETTLVQLNVGSSGGIKQNYLFQVHRDGQYLGSVIIMTVDEQAAVGRVRLLKTGAEIKTGDAARSGPIN